MLKNKCKYMIYLKLFEGFVDIDVISIPGTCNAYGIKNYTINSDGSIDVDGNVYLHSPTLRYLSGARGRLVKLPLKFNVVYGDFLCFNNQLKTLEGGPKEVGGSFNCSDNELTSLVGAPIRVGGEFYCGHNKLVSLEGSPKEVGGNFNCNSNSQLKTLEGAPKEVGGNFSCHFNELNTLEGATKEIGGHFGCAYNPLPQLIYDNKKYIKEIIKWQDEYNIWRNGTLDEFRFGEMMIDIKNEVGS